MTNVSEKRFQTPILFSLYFTFSSSLSLFFLTFTFLYLRWNQGLVFHQGLVDLLRSLLLLPLAFSILSCRPIYRCLPIRNSYLINQDMNRINISVAIFWRPASLSLSLPARLVLNLHFVKPSNLFRQCISM